MNSWCVEISTHQLFIVSSFKASYIMSINCSKGPSTLYQNLCPNITPALCYKLYSDTIVYTFPHDTFHDTLISIQWNALYAGLPELQRLRLSRQVHVIKCLQVYKPVQILQTPQYSVKWTNATSTWTVQIQWTDANAFITLCTTTVVFERMSNVRCPSQQI